MNVYVVVLNWNGKDFIEKCLVSLENQSQECKTLVIDNGSKDGSVEIIESVFSKIKLIKELKNHGFAGGVNIGIEQAIKIGADYIALFNNDAVADPNWLKNLVETAKENPKAGIITSKLMRTDKKHFDSTGDFYSIWGMPFPRGRNQEDNGQFNQQEEVFGASGGASLYKAKMLEEIGLFDERFFAYFEDVDISFRAQLAGWKVIYNPKAIAYHKVSATSSKMAKSFTRYHSIKNFNLIYWKNMPGVLFFKYLPLFLIQGLRLGVSSAIRGGFFTYIKGLVSAVIYIPTVFFVERRKIQKSKKVSAIYIDSILFHGRPPKIPQIKTDNKAG